MAIAFKCKMCGGDLAITEGSAVAQCEYCGTQQTVPSLDNEKKANLFARAQHLLRNNEFDRAAGVYESIVSEFTNEAEAYWGLCLCKYGIEYVDDPNTGKKVPTCHRTSYQSIFDDANFEQALDWADAAAIQLYRAEAKEIDRLQRSILEIASKEDPFDVFICYKETAEDGQRTKDSVMAQDIYTALTKEGYKVFFSRITLEDKLGAEYEPYIFAALNSAKVMLAIGTKYEYYNAVWVKNEWSRFIEMKKQHPEKVLIPCYSDIDAYDLPVEFKNLQGQDMNKVGFIQDLIRGIGKIIPLEKEQPAQNAAFMSAANTAATVSVQSLLNRAAAYLEDGDWDNAAAYCEKVLDIDVQCAEAYVYYLMADLGCTQREELGELRDTFYENPNYIKAMRYGDDALCAELDGYSAQANENMLTDMRNEMYDLSAETIENSNQLDDLRTALSALEDIPDWRDAGTLIEKCKRKIDDISRYEAWRSRVQFAEQQYYQKYPLAARRNEINRNYDEAKDDFKRFIILIIGYVVAIVVAALCIVPFASGNHGAIGIILMIVGGLLILALNFVGFYLLWKITSIFKVIYATIQYKRVSKIPEFNPNDIQ